MGRSRSRSRSPPRRPARSSSRERDRDTDRRRRSSRSRSRSRDRDDRSRRERRTRSSRSRSPPTRPISTRDRSRSRDRDHDRDRDRDRDWDRDRDRDRGRDRDRRDSPPRNKTISRAERQAVPFGERSKKAEVKEDAKGPESLLAKITPDMSPEQVMNILGLPKAFDTSKNKFTPDSAICGVRLKSKREYRQYMNRKGGFNRELDESY